MIEYLRHSLSPFSLLLSFAPPSPQAELQSILANTKGSAEHQRAGSKGSRGSAGGSDHNMRSPGGPGVSDADAAHVRESKLHSDALTRMMMQKQPQHSEQQHAAHGTASRYGGAAMPVSGAAPSGSGGGAMSPSPYQLPLKLPQEQQRRRNGSAPASASGTRAGAGQYSLSPQQQYEQQLYTSQYPEQSLGGVPSSYFSSAGAGGALGGGLGGYAAAYPLTTPSSAAGPTPTGMSALATYGSMGLASSSSAKTPTGLNPGAYTFPSAASTNAAPLGLSANYASSGYAQ